ncbi:MAG: dihydropteroate synthase [Bacteroidales bacterium]
MSSIKVRGELLELSVPKVMGILNVTPDSFYRGSRSGTAGEIKDLLKQMVGQGVDIVDIGGYSSRPGAGEVPEKEEIARVSMAFEITRSLFPELLTSVDTFRASVARVAIEDFGVDMINDITGGTGDPGMIGLVAGSDLPYIMMHMQGRPSDMQSDPHYENVVNDLLQWFAGRIVVARNAGIKDIVVDPGFGFGKTIAHNYEIINSLKRFGELDCPVMVGLSRKSMIWKVLGSDPDNVTSLNGTIALNTIALLNGASLIRVHDVAEAVMVVNLVQRVRGIG